MIDNECLKCKRYFTNSCDGVEDRNRKEITIENSCSGFLYIETEDIIHKLSYILEELEAREISNNCVVKKLYGKSWSELCEEAIRLLEQIK